MTATEDKALTDLKESLQTFLGNRLVRLVLFGSRARGDYSGESDFDFADVMASSPKERKSTRITARHN